MVVSSPVAPDVNTCQRVQEARCTGEGEIGKTFAPIASRSQPTRPQLPALSYTTMNHAGCTYHKTPEGTILCAGSDCARACRQPCVCWSKKIKQRRVYEYNNLKYEKRGERRSPEISRFLPLSLRCSDNPQRRLAQRSKQRAVANSPHLCCRRARVAPGRVCFFWRRHM